LSPVDCVVPAVYQHQRYCECISLRRKSKIGLAKNRGLDMPNVADAAYIDLYRFMVLSMTEDAKESHNAWRERRRPKGGGK
jgi:hypothetical protein